MIDEMFHRWDSTVDKSCFIQSFLDFMMVVQCIAIFLVYIASSLSLPGILFIVFRHQHERHHYLHLLQPNDLVPLRH